MSLRITGLDPAPFRRLRDLPDDELLASGARRVIADAHPGYPDRVTQRNADPGETLLPVDHVHQPAPGSYRASHVIFVLERATEPATFVDEVPDAIRRRPVSLRGYDRGHDMVDADLVDGERLVRLIERMLARADVAYLHAHYATRGCFAALVRRT